MKLGVIFAGMSTVVPHVVQSAHVVVTMRIRLLSHETNVCVCTSCDMVRIIDNRSGIIKSTYSFQRFYKSNIFVNRLTISRAPFVLVAAAVSARRKAVNPFLFCIPKSAPC